jgi:hypothetical protein
MNSSGNWCRTRGANLHLKREATNAYQKALRSGSLVRRPCEICGKTAEGHHDDYADPTNVTWLCRFHHANWHQGHSLEEMRNWREAA